MQRYAGLHIPVGATGDVDLVPGIFHDRRTPRYLRHTAIDLHHRVIDCLFAGLAHRCFRETVDAEAEAVALVEGRIEAFGRHATVRCATGDDPPCCSVD